MFSCNKKTHPSKAPSENSTSSVSKNTDSAGIKKYIVKPIPTKLTSVPKVIVVSDAGAKRSVDGRLYYDLQGHRYWRNNKDGKYYIYNKSMASNPEYKPPAKN